jgi:hypothetical protein
MRVLATSRCVKRAGPVVVELRGGIAAAETYEVPWGSVWKRRKGIGLEKYNNMEEYERKEVIRESFVQGYPSQRITAKRKKKRSGNQAHLAMSTIYHR